MKNVSSETASVLIAALILLRSALALLVPELEIEAMLRSALEKPVETLCVMGENISREGIRDTISEVFARNESERRVPALKQATDSPELRQK